MSNSLEALKDTAIWLRSALECKSWNWDPDQRAAAEEACAVAERTIESMPAPQTPSISIHVAGPTGVGKSTLINKLADFLAGENVLVTVSDPDQGGPISDVPVVIHEIVTRSIDAPADNGTLQYMGRNGARWAKEFSRIAVQLGYSPMDEGWLIGWFANAIEAGKPSAAVFVDIPKRRDNDPILTVQTDGTIKSMGIDFDSMPIAQQNLLFREALQALVRPFTVSVERTEPKIREVDVSHLTPDQIKATTDFVIQNNQPKGYSL